MTSVRAKPSAALETVRNALTDQARQAAGSNTLISRAEQERMPDGLLKDAAAQVRAAHPGAAPTTAAVVDAAAQQVAQLMDGVNLKGKGTLSKQEVLALARQNLEAGEQVARAYELITGRPVDVGGVSGIPSSSLAAGVPADWRAALADELDQPYFKELERFLADERSHASIMPPPDQVFAALRRTPLEKVKVVLLGQDPYPTAGNANGLSFSVSDGKAVPASLRNMFNVMRTDVGAHVPNHGNLESWADQGVLLLNTVLTVREGEANSHKNQGWERFTRAILDKVNQKPDRVVFLLLGKQAQRVASTVDTTIHAVVAAPHPSPMSPGNPFGKTRPYSAVNHALAEAGRPQVNWSIADRG